MLWSREMISTGSAVTEEVFQTLKVVPLGLKLQMSMLPAQSEATDPVASAELYALAKQLNREKNITVIMVTHDIERAVKNADVMLHLAESGDHFFGTPEQYMKTDLAKRFICGE